MGRRPDSAAMQAAKGKPSHRAKKSAAERHAEEVERVSRLLVAVPDQIGGVELPAIMLEPHWAPVVAVWREHAPELRRTNRLARDHAILFASFCVYAYEFLKYADDVLRNGPTQRVKIIAGGSQEKMRPSVALRDNAHAEVLRLSGHFGMTPGDMYALFKDQAAAVQSNPNLFGDGRVGERRSPSQTAAADDAPAPEGVITGAPRGSVIGSAARLRSTPPAGTA